MYITIINQYLQQETESEGKSVSICLGGDRADGPAGETGAMIELCHVMLAVQTQTV